jgi:hypothetical protein
LAKIFPLKVRLTEDKAKEIIADYWLCSSQKSIDQYKIQYNWCFSDTIKVTSWFRLPTQPVPARTQKCGRS